MRDVAPGLVPTFDVALYLVLDDLDHLGRAYLTSNEEKSDRDTVIRRLLGGEYNKPVRIVAFNTAEFWSRDVSEDVAWEVVKRAVESGSRLPEGTYRFVAFHLGEHVALRAQNALL
jgi:hypothetical protein